MSFVVNWVKGKVAGTVDTGIDRAAGAAVTSANDVIYQAGGKKSKTKHIRKRIIDKYKKKYQTRKHNKKRSKRKISFYLM